MSSDYRVKYQIDANTVISSVYILDVQLYKAAGNL